MGLLGRLGVPRRACPWGNTSLMWRSWSAAWRKTCRSWMSSVTLSSTWTVVKRMRMGETFSSVDIWSKSVRYVVIKNLCVFFYASLLILIISHCSQNKYPPVLQNWYFFCIKAQNIREAAHWKNKLISKSCEKNCQ